MPRDFSKGKVHTLANGRIRLFIGDTKLVMTVGTNSQRSTVCLPVNQFGSVMQVMVQGTDKDGNPKPKATSVLKIVSPKGSVLAELDCNSASNAATVAGMLFQWQGLGQVEGIESIFDPDPTKGPPRRGSKKSGGDGSKAVKTRAPKKAPASRSSSSSSSAAKSKKSVGKKAPPAAKPQPVQDDSDDDDSDAPLQSESDDE